MPNDSPSPLALAREAEKTAENVYHATVMVHLEGNDDEDGEDCRVAHRRWKAAQRTHHEALVEATLRWRKRNPGYRHVGQCIYNDSGDVLTMADVLTAIEEGR